eukprot:7275008-Pyramimonas_sp.AAC.1
MAEDGRPSVEGEDLGDWESSALLVFRVNGHALLGAKVLDAVGNTKGRLQFCVKCGSFCSGGNPSKGLQGPCRPKTGATGGLSDQLRRIRQSKFPSYKHDLKGLLLGPHVGLSLVERRTLAVALMSGGPGTQRDSHS